MIRDESLIENAARVGGILLDGLREIASRHQILTEVRGRAMWIGMSFPDHDVAGAVELASFRRGLLVLGCGDDAIRMSPPLVFREDQAAASLEIFEEALAEVEATGA